MRHVLAVLAAMSICTISLAKPLYAAEPAVKVAGIPVPAPSAFAIHGNAGLVWYELWDREQAPAFDQLRPTWNLSLALGAPGSKGLTLQGALLVDMKRLDKARAGWVGVGYDF